MFINNLNEFVRCDLTFHVSFLLVHTGVIADGFRDMLPPRNSSSGHQEKKLDKPEKTNGRTDAPLGGRPSVRFFPHDVAR